MTTEQRAETPEASRLEHMKATWPRGPRGAVYLISVLRMQRREVVHSDILRWLLDPRGSHDLGGTFLGEILQLVPGPSLGTGSLETARVKREVVRAETRADIGDRWSPDRPTLVFIGTVAIGLTIYELSEQAPVRWDWKTSKHVRLNSTPSAEKMRLLPAYDRPYQKDLPSGRFGLRAYAADRWGEWEKHWHESRKDELRDLFEAIGTELETGVKRPSRRNDAMRLRRDGVSILGKT